MLCSGAPSGNFLPSLLQVTLASGAEILPLSLVQENIKGVLFQTWEGRGGEVGVGVGFLIFTLV